MGKCEFDPSAGASSSHSAERFHEAGLPQGSLPMQRRRCSHWPVAGENKSRAPPWGNLIGNDLLAVTSRLTNWGAGPGEAN
ncbi:MAG: hypothetical protein CBB71_13290 [Rhodopirellula sp. TMED11]|nr:MAG: hypothetical protein CBB71_13290 [Rhodopirellula sp. TMED11]